MGAARTVQLGGGAVRHKGNTGKGSTNTVRPVSLFRRIRRRILCARTGPWCGRRRCHCAQSQRRAGSAQRRPVTSTCRRAVGPLRAPARPGRDERLRTSPRRPRPANVAAWWHVHVRRSATAADNNVAPIVWRLQPLEPRTTRSTSWTSRSGHDDRPPDPRSRPRATTTTRLHTRAPTTPINSRTVAAARRQQPERQDHHLSETTQIPGGDYYVHATMSVTFQASSNPPSNTFALNMLNVPPGRKRQPTPPIAG